MKAQSELVGSKPVGVGRRIMMEGMEARAAPQI